MVCQNFILVAQLWSLWKKWPHLDNIVSVTGDDKADIISKRSALCQQINNVLCFLAVMIRLQSCHLCRLTAIWRCSLVPDRCFYIRDVCVVWRKGLRRTWDLPHNTHCNLLPLLCDVLPLMDKICEQNLLRTHLIATATWSVCCKTWRLLRSDVVADWRKCIFLLLEIWCFAIWHCIYY